MKYKLTFLPVLGLLVIALSVYGSSLFSFFNTAFEENDKAVHVESTDMARKAENLITLERNADALQKGEVNTAQRNDDEPAIVCEADLNASAEEIRDEISATLEERQSDDNERQNGGITTGVVERGDTVGKILQDASQGGVEHYISAMRKVFSPASFKPGQSYTVVTDPESGKVKRFEYEINDLSRLVVEGAEKPKARLEDIKYNVTLEAIACIIEDNLFQAVTNAGEKPQLAVEIARIFGSEINFVKNLQDGDHFIVLVEKRYRNGNYCGYGRILAARFVNRGKTYEAFLFRDETGKTQYYNGKGENLKKVLLQAPLAVTRLTSRFSHNRRHPILGTSRPHLGVDYGAPTGTPVKAVGDGIIVSRGWAGGFGNQVIIRHSSGLESQYAHLSRFAKNLREGQTVGQGQVIGYVGSTGLSTGPHLDFRLKHNGKYIDPTKAINPRAASVQARLYEEFVKTTAQERAYLDGHRLPRNYSVDLLVPVKVATKIKEETKRSASTAPKKVPAHRRRIARNITKNRS